MPRPLPPSFECHVKGVSFTAGYPANLLALQEEEFGGDKRVLHLEHELDNPVDDFAVAVWDEGRVHKYGHMPAAVVDRLARELDDGVCWEIEDWEINVVSSKPEQPGLVIRCRRAE